MIVVRLHLIKIVCTSTDLALFPSLSRPLALQESNPLIHRGSHDLLRSLKEIGKMCIDAHKRPPQLLMVIVPDRMSYEALKRVRFLHL